MVVNTLRVKLPLAELAGYCRQNGIIELALFGSALRDDFGPESDIDLLVTFSPNAAISLMDHVRMEEELSEILGRPVDLISKRGIEQSQNWIRRVDILSSARVIHAD